MSEKEESFKIKAVHVLFRGVTDASAPLVDAALSDDKSDLPVSASFDCDVRIRLSDFCTPSRRPAGNVSKTEGDTYTAPMFGTMINFPRSTADQAHGLSISELIKRGQGDVGKIHDADYDFPDGKDTGIDSNPLMAWTEIAELSELEHDKASALQEQIAQRREDEVVKKAKQSTSKQSTETQSTETQSTEKQAADV